MKRYFLYREKPSLKVDYEKDLNTEQYAAVMHKNGPALVLAGAGTGKTRVVTYRVARLIETGISAENILLLTFTNKAAKEMMRRVEQLAGKNISGLFGGTFHHIANLLLRQHHTLCGYRQGFSILDREDTKELFNACISEVYKKDIVLPKGAVLSEIYSLSKNTETEIADIIKLRFTRFESLTEEIVKIASIYEKKKMDLNLMDFDDLLVNWRRLFLENQKIREYYSLKFKYILVDEYQDTNRLQAEIIDLTVGDEKNLMVVGDDAQSIYSFRGADFENILGFPEKYTGTAIYKLTTNYRSTPEILDVANSLIVHNRRQFQKELYAVAKSGEKPALVPLRDIFEQAEYVASVITDMNSEGISFDKIAVLYRSHYQSMELQMELQRRGIAFEVRSGLKFFEQAHIKDVLSFLRVIINSRDEISWKRILKLVPGIGNITAGKIWERISITDSPLESLFEIYQHIPKKAIDGFNLFLELMREIKNTRYLSVPAQAIDYVLSHGYEDYLYNTYPNAEFRIEDIHQMAKFASRYDSLEAFLSDITLQGVADSETEDISDTEGRVVLSTVHQAKGLEWNVVFIIGLNDGKFPSLRSIRNDDEEEERRLFYVAITRARDTLFLCYPVTSDDWQGIGFVRPSRFIKEIPEDYIEEITVESG